MTFKLVKMVVNNEVFRYIPIPDKLYNIEFLRRQHFQFWKGDAAFSETEAYKRGFYHKRISEHPDDICCINCDAVMYEWEVDDDLYLEHERLSPYCKNKHFNVPMNFIHLSQYLLDSWFEEFYNHQYLVNPSEFDVITSDKIKKFKAYFTIRAKCPYYKSNAIREYRMLYDNEYQYIFPPPQ